MSTCRSAKITSKISVQCKKGEMNKQKKSAFVLSTPVSCMQKTKKAQPSKAEMPFLLFNVANDIK